MSKHRYESRSDPSSNESEYPYNKVFSSWTEGVLHIDDTPGEARWFYRHSSGSYGEWSSDGKVVHFTVGDIKNYGKGGVTFTVDENNDVKISGHNRLLVGGGAHIEVAGDAGIAVGGTTALVGMGKVNVRSKFMYLSSDQDMNFNCGGNCSMKVKGTMTTEAGEKIVDKAPRIDHNP